MIITTTKNFHNLCYPQRNDHTFIKIIYLILIIPRREKKRFCVEQNATLKPRLQKIMGNILLTLSSLTSLPLIKTPPPHLFCSALHFLHFISSPPPSSLKDFGFQMEGYIDYPPKVVPQTRVATQRPAILAQLTRFES